MQQLEFKVQAKNGIIQIPSKFKKYENAFLKILIQPAVKENQDMKKQKILQIVNQIKDKQVFKNICNPLEWQKELRDEWK